MGWSIEPVWSGPRLSAVAGLTRCFIQPRSTTPKPVWNPDVRQTINFFDQWQEVPDNDTYQNGFRTQWELFTRHLFENAPFKWDLLAGARGVQLAELGMKSWVERRWTDIPDLEA